jgi:hypothetical protein
MAKKPNPVNTITLVHEAHQRHSSQISRAVDARDEAEAIQRAIKEFKVPENLQDRIVATRDDF